MGDHHHQVQQREVCQASGLSCEIAIFVSLVTVCGSDGDSSSKQQPCCFRSSRPTSQGCYCTRYFGRGRERVSSCHVRFTLEMQWSPLRLRVSQMSTFAVLVDCWFDHSES